MGMGGVIDLRLINLKLITPPKDRNSHSVTLVPLIN